MFSNVPGDMPAPEGGHQSSSRCTCHSAPARSVPTSAQGTLACTRAPVVWLWVIMGMPRAQVAVPTGLQGEPFAAMGPPEPVGGAPLPYHSRLSGPKSMR